MTVSHLPTFRTFPGEIGKDNIFIRMFLLMFFPASLHKEGISRHSTTRLVTVPRHVDNN